MADATPGTDAGGIGTGVLVVEDEWLIAFMIADTLGDAGYRVCGPVSSVEQARALMVEEAIDLAVLDVNLGAEQSLVLVDELTAQGVKVILTTGYHNDDLPPQFQVLPILGKPFSGKILLEALARLHGDRLPGG